MVNDEVCFKVYGLEDVLLEKYVKEISSSSGAEIKISGNYPDNKLTVLGQGDSLDKAEKEIVKRLKRYIYAECDMTLQETLVFLLKLRKLKLSVAESFTGGTLSSTVISVPGASEVFYEGIVSYDSESKIRRLKVNPDSIRYKHPVSKEVAGEMASGLYLSGVPDVTLSTTGIAGPSSDDSNFPVGLCYIGVGIKGKIKVYRYEFTGDRREIIKLGTNTALFLAVMNIKNL